MVKKDMDLLAQLSAAGKDKHKKSNIFAFVLPPIIAVIAAGAILLAGSAAESGAEKELEKAKEKTIALEEKQEGFQIEDAENRADELEKALEAFENISDQKEAVPDLDKDIVLQINNCLDGVSFQQGRLFRDRLELEFSAADREDISRFVTKLEEKRIFSSIDYQGFEEQRGEYGFTLICYTSETNKEAAE